MSSDAPPEISVLIPIIGRVDDLSEIHRAVSKEVGDLTSAYEFLYLVASNSEDVLDQVRALYTREPDLVRVAQFALPVTEAAMLAAGA